MSIIINKIKNHPVITAVIIFSIGATSAWKIADQVLVKPRDFEIERLRNEISFLKESGGSTAASNWKDPSPELLRAQLGFTERIVLYNVAMDESDLLKIPTSNSILIKELPEIEKEGWIGFIEWAAKSDQKEHKLVLLTTIRDLQQLKLVQAQMSDPADQNSLKVSLTDLGKKVIGPYIRD
jgi:hypothetical protein